MSSVPKDKILNLMKQPANLDLYVIGRLKVRNKSRTNNSQFDQVETI
jgi:hypothetical protein